MNIQNGGPHTTAYHLIDATTKELSFMCPFLPVNGAQVVFERF